MRQFLRPKSRRLSAVELFSSCTARDLGLIAKLADEVVVPAGSVLAREWGVARTVYLVAEGTAALRVRGQLVGTAGPGSRIGELEVLASDVSQVEATAVTPMRVFVFDARGFSAMLRGVPSVAVRLLRGLACRELAARQPGTIDVEISQRAGVGVAREALSA